MRTTNVLVTTSQRYQVECLGQTGPRSDGAALAAFQRGNMTAELRVDHSNLDVLYDHRTDVTNRLPGIVRYDDVGSNLLSVIVNFSIQSDFKVDLSVAESESFAHERARQTTSTGCWCVLQL